MPTNSTDNQTPRMKNNWIKTVASINREKFTIPEGWDTREQVAESLECSPDRVSDILKHGIQSGQIERQDFPVWDDNRRLTTRVVCYRIGSSNSKPEPSQLIATSSSERKRVIRALKRNPNRSDSEIANNNQSTPAFVKQLRAQL